MSNDNESDKEEVNVNDSEREDVEEDSDMDNIKREEDQGQEEEQDQEEEVEEVEEEEEEEVREEDLDASTQKIIQLYEIISELIEEQKARTQDLHLLTKGTTIEEIMKIVEERNDTFLQSLQTEFGLKKTRGSRPT
ncbi:hypothetical protein RFI_28440 [Reticulomyxa filosa]|uniref:Uncharacterized protein n=1 Tax=Reticulomyxa filosa TaxID=46433 RepID=X6M4X4_RETFI|nr:hypothetical protein RFI_28440 [Reticulomyxa filosa]|eukprot:ETO08949.1 hypothetical protein RFI_28440 [Reticulomyxa filosa]